MINKFPMITLSPHNRYTPRFCLILFILTVLLLPLLSYSQAKATICYLLTVPWGSHLQELQCWSGIWDDSRSEKCHISAAPHPCDTTTHSVLLSRTGWVCYHGCVWFFWGGGAWEWCICGYVHVLLFGGGGGGEFVYFLFYFVARLGKCTMPYSSVSMTQLLTFTYPHCTASGQFPGEHGLVAPGMSCHFTMHFSPDSLGDFDDYIMVHTQSSAPVVIRLEGRRPPPTLTCNLFIMKSVKSHLFGLRQSLNVVWDLSTDSVT